MRTTEATNVASIGSRENQRRCNRSILFRDPDDNLVNLFTPVKAEALERFS